MTKIFVYGTLRDGECRGYIMSEGGEFIRNATTAPLYTLKNLKSFPALIENGHNCITGEIWEVSDDLLARLDMIEGVSKGGDGLYYREEVLVDSGCRPEEFDSYGFGLALAYFMKPEQAADYPEIKSGDWKNRD
jgi:gamma-glutamylcyclotransferase (GGCT)/AIG2-like uncharacterized protein YtfP